MTYGTIWIPFEKTIWAAHIYRSHIGILYELLTVSRISPHPSNGNEIDLWLKRVLECSIGEVRVMWLLSAKVSGEYKMTMLRKHYFQ